MLVESECVCVVYVTLMVVVQCVYGCMCVCVVYVTLMAVVQCVYVCMCECVFTDPPLA
jgi:hypothetical protein